MATEILPVREHILEDVIKIIRAGLLATDKYESKTIEEAWGMLDNWCWAEIEYLKED